MSAAVLGFIGVIVGLAVGRGYGFWASRRGELAEAAVAAAVLSEQLRVLRAEGSAENLTIRDAWEEGRRWLVIHFSPADFVFLADAVNAACEDAEPFGLTGLLARTEALHLLFWEEHEAFILVPLIRYLSGDTVSKRIHDIIDPARDVDTLGAASTSSALRGWHSPPA
ncbi:MAG TPA: hypothetical protein VG898_08530 [Solirubrobacterales bacterium]|nr:hypothetical protein [Solirubrobacterales bacterium]